MSIRTYRPEGKAGSSAGTSSAFWKNREETGRGGPGGGPIPGLSIGGIPGGAGSGTSIYGPAGILPFGTPGGGAGSLLARFGPRALAAGAAAGGSSGGYSGSAKGAAKDLVKAVIPLLTGAAPEALGTGLGTLQEILLGQGQTDPALLNRNLADIARTTQGQQTALQEQLARLGLSGSIAGQVGVGGAIGAAGGERRAGALAQETALAEQRKRDDLIRLLLPLIIQPGQQSLANIFGLSAASAGQPSDLEVILGGASGVLGAAGAAGGFSNLFSGGGGGSADIPT